MKIGIDISQLAYEQTGVANYLKHLVDALLRSDSTNEYILFYASLRKPLQSVKLNTQSYNAKCKIKSFYIPPSILNIFWNKLHIFPLEWFVGEVDVFITSDWTEPPAKKAKKMTILYDLILYKYPKETAEKIVSTQKRKLHWVKKESQKILCISQATKKDAIEILGIDEKRLGVVYPGL